MLAKGAAKHHATRLRIRRVAVLPQTAVNRVHQLTATSDHADRHATTQHLAVSRQVGLDAKISLGPTLVNAKARDHFVEDEQGARRARNLA